MNENEINKIERRIDARIGVGVKKIIGVTAALFVLLAFGISSPIMWLFGRVNTKFGEVIDEVKALVEKNTAAIGQLSESIDGLKSEYAKGEGVPRDYVEAAKWYRKAAEQGIATAQFALGEMYHKNEGVPRDYVEAAKWYRKAAEQGNDKAQSNLGEMYHKGEGVPQDYVEAAKWYRKAAEQGNDKAQLFLGLVYAIGQGVPKNDIEAYAWFLVAKAKGNEEASKAISIYEELLTAEQIKKGQARAADLQLSIGVIHL